jgi:hypothetical protein
MNNHASTDRRGRIARVILAIPFLLLPGILFGCAGYHVGPVTKTSFHSIAVPMFRNETLRPQLEAKITNEILRRLQQDGSLQIEPQSRADVILTGTVVRYERIALRSLQSDTGVPREYRIVITVRVEVRDRRTGETVLNSTKTSKARKCRRCRWWPTILPGESPDCWWRAGRRNLVSSLSP